MDGDKMHSTSFREVSFIIYHDVWISSDNVTPEDLTLLKLIDEVKVYWKNVSFQF